MFQRESTQSRLEQQEKSDVGPRFLDTELLGIECVKQTSEVEEDLTADYYSGFDPATELVFRKNSSARMRLAQCEKLLDGGIDAFTAEKLARIEYDRFWQTGGQLRQMWRSAESHYGSGDDRVHVRDWDIPKQLLDDCERAGYSRSKVAECYAQMVQQSLTGRYSRSSVAPTGAHAKHLIKWLQYLSPDHDSGWTVPWPDALGEKSLPLHKGPQENNSFWPTVVKLFQEGFRNRYGRVHGGIMQRLKNLADVYRKMLAKGEKKDIWFGPKSDDFFYFRTIPRTGVMIDVDQYRPSPELFEKALDSGVSPEGIRKALDEYREKCMVRFDDVALHEWRMQRFIYHIAILEGIDVDKAFRRASKETEVAFAHASVIGRFFGIINRGSKMQRRTPIVDRWGLFAGIYPPAAGGEVEPKKAKPVSVELPPDSPEEQKRWAEIESKLEESRKRSNRPVRKPKRRDPLWEVPIEELERRANAALNGGKR